MNIQIAAGYLKYGYNLYREEWTNKWIFVVDENNIQSLYWSDGTYCILELEDLLADDWQILYSKDEYGNF